MKKPNAVLQRTDPGYIVDLLADLKQFGWSRRAVCKELGIGYRSMTDYVTGNTTYSYAVQYAIESLHSWARELYISSPYRDKVDADAETA